MSENYIHPVDEIMFHDSHGIFIRNQIWKLSPSMVTQVKFSESGDQFHEEFRDGIQARRRANIDPRTKLTGLAGLRLRLRRLLDGDTRIHRKRRYKTFLENVRPAQENGHVAIPFQTDSDEHTKAALSKLLTHTV